MRVWWLKGYVDGEYDLGYSAFIHYGECMAKKASEQLKYPNHTFVVKEGEI